MLRNLVRNVFAGQVFWFVLPPTIVAIFLTLSGVSRSYTILAIVFFGIMVFAWAIIFPIKFGKLPGKATDFWYYTIAAIGVVLFFVNEDNEREKVLLAETYTAHQIELADLIERRPAAEIVFSDPQVLFRQIQEKAAMLSEIYSDRAIQETCINRQADQFSQRYQDLMEDRSERWPDVELPNMTDQLCERYVPWQSDLEAVARAENPAALAGFIRLSNADELQRLLDINLGPFSLFEAATYIASHAEGKSIAEQIAESERFLSNEIDGLKMKYANVGRVLEGQSGTMWASFQHFLWPYLLLIALGLKLARVPYAGNKPVEDE